MSIEARSQRYGKLFSHWQIREQIGQGSGGRAVVFKMVNADNQWEYCALKSICLIEERGSLDKLTAQARKEYTEARESYSRQAEQEVRLMSVLRGNTNVVDYLDHAFQDWSDETGFGRDLLIRMELLRDLRRELRADRVFDREEIIRLGLDICTALRLCQRKNILHRDIKPENIFINDTGSYKLGDFGISRIIAATPASTASTGIGTPEYAAPEQAGGHYTRTVDIYSLGLVLYELANGNRLPFAASRYVRQSEVLRRNMGEPLPRPCNADDALAEVILKACAFHSEDRYQSAEEFYDALKALEGQAPIFSQPVQQAPAEQEETGSENVQEAPEPPAFAAEPESYATAPAGFLADAIGGKAKRRKARLLPLYLAAACAAALLAGVLGYKNCWFGHRFAEGWSMDADSHWHAAICGHDGVTADAAAHTWDSGTVTAEAAHTSVGTIRYTCTVCGQAKEEAIAKLTEHTYDQEIVDAKYLKSEATCTEPAMYYYSCECGEAGTGTFSDGEAIGHNWQDATVFAPQTCLNCGEQIGSATTAVSSGTCGDNLEWALDDAGTLTIRGSGAMEDFSRDGAPWFGQRDEIKKIVIENGVTTIGTHAFRTCSRLTSVSIPDSVTTIKNCAFYWDRNLKSAAIPASVTTIESFAFYRCENLSVLTLPDSVTAIGDAAFGYCFALTSVTIPGSVISLGSNPFCGCGSLMEILVDEDSENYTSVNGIIFSKSEDEILCYPAGKFASFYTIPDTVTFVGSAAFEGADNLLTITLPDSVTSIGSYAFCFCTGLTSISVPNSVTFVGKNAFDSCTNLEIVRYTGTEADFGEMTIESDGNDCLTNAAWHYGEQADESEITQAEMEALFADAQALTESSAEAFTALLSDDGVSAILIPANGSVTVPSGVCITKPVAVEGYLGSAGTLTVDGENACVYVKGELAASSVLRTINGGRVIAGENSTLKNVNVLWLENSEDMTNLGGSMPGDTQIATCSENALRNLGTKVSTARDFVAALSALNTKAIIVTGDITVDAEGATTVYVPVPILIDEGASLTVINTSSETGPENYLYLATDSCLINSGTLNATVNTGVEMRLLVNRGSWTGGVWSSCTILVNYGDMAITLASSGTFGSSSRNGGTLGNTGHFFNEGTLTITEEAAPGGAFFANGIFVNCESGTIVADCNFTLSCGLIADNQGTILVESGTFYNTVRLKNSGTIEISANGSFSNSGVLLNEGNVSSAGDLDNSDSGLILTAENAVFSAASQPGGHVETVGGTASGSAWKEISSPADLEAAMNDASIAGITLWLTEDSDFTGDLTVTKPLVIRNYSLSISGTLTVADDYAAAIDAGLSAANLVLENNTFFYSDGNLWADNVTVGQSAAFYYFYPSCGEYENEYEYYAATLGSSITVDGGTVKILSRLILTDADITLRRGGTLGTNNAPYLGFQSCTVDIDAKSFLNLGAYWFDADTTITNNGHIALLNGNWIDARMEGTLVNNGALIAYVMDVYGVLENNGRIYCTSDSDAYAISAKGTGEIRGNEILPYTDGTDWWNG